ncbi:hypothetical protein GGI08_002629, partial [Coemansia sp. S2]
MPIKWDVSLLFAYGGYNVNSPLLQQLVDVDLNSMAIKKTIEDYNINSQIKYKFVDKHGEVNE